jgi:N-acetylmuramoyl-L-alanine amidase
MKTIGKIGYISLGALLTIDIALVGPLGKKVAEYIVPNQIEQVSNYDQEILARAIFGEARGSSKELKIAVAQTIQNRVKDNRWPNTLEGVITQPYQFSCFNENDPNHNKVWNPEKVEPNSWKECLGIAKEVLEGKYKDSTSGANHYHTDKVNPKWSRNKTPIKKINNTLFFDL